MFHDGAYFMGGLHGLGWLFWVAVIAVLVVAVWGRRGRHRDKPRETPLEVLKGLLTRWEGTRRGPSR